MSFPKCKIDAEDARFLQEEFRNRALEREGIFSYATSIGSASEVNDYSAEEIGHDYDFLAIPKKEVPMGEFLSEVYEMSREVNESLQEYYNEQKIGAPFPESHIQNLALREAAQEEAKIRLGPDAPLSDLENKTQEMYDNVVGQHIILADSWEGIRNNLPDTFPIKSGKTILGSPENIPEKKYEDLSIATPYFEGIHKHAGAMIAPDTYSKDAVTGAVAHAIDQAEKETGEQLASQKVKQEAQKSVEEALNSVEQALTELDSITADKHR